MDRYLLPDFATYPTEHRVAAVELISGGVVVAWEDGHRTEHHRLVLREHSPDPLTTHPLSREQQLQLADIPADLTIVGAEPHEHGGLTVWWSDGPLDSSTYHPGWLRVWGVNPSPSPRPPDHRAALPPQTCWDASLDLDALRFDGASMLTTEGTNDAFGGWLRGIWTHGVAIAEGLPIEEQTIFDLPSLIGPIRETNFGAAFDVRTKTDDVTSNAYTDLELPVHTDLDTREYMPGLQFLFCMVNDADGGESRLTDAATITQYLREHHADAFDALTTIPVTFLNKATDSDYRHVAPFLVVDDEGELIEARWSPWLRGPLQASMADADRFYDALRLAVTLAEDARFVVSVKLKAGEMLGFDNRRMLHGRAGLDRSTGDRWLRGCYVEREELESRLRILARPATQ